MRAWEGPTVYRGRGAQLSLEGPSCLWGGQLFMEGGQVCMGGGQLSMGGEEPAVCPAVYGGANGGALKG
jgi:hypothetical protein